MKENNFKRENKRRSGGGGGRRFNGGGRFNKRSSSGGRGERKKLDIVKFIEANNLSFEKSNLEQVEYKAENLYKDFNIDERLKKNIERKGYKEPTPIQDKTIPLILEGKDVIGLANTGTGKTAAFLVPSINKVLLNRKEKVLIIVPTRELAIQVEKEFKGFVGDLGMKSILCIGGDSIRKQLFQFKRNYEFVVGTPGRMKDLINRNVLNLSQFKTLILDEADRMLDMGFINDIKFIINKMPEGKQTLFFSATISREIEGLVNNFLKNPITISVKKAEFISNIEQKIVRAKGKEKKLNDLCRLLSQDDFKKVLIFERTKIGAERLSMELYKRDFKVESIHGDKSLYKRKRALEAFKSNKVEILVATDVAARGLDINDVTHVINYELPESYDDYIHRIGRTGRCQKKGVAITFVG